MEIKLIFNSDNNFDCLAEKHDTKNDRLSIARNAHWVINNAMASIQKCYRPGAPRLIEMEKMYNDLLLQLKSQLTQEEIETLKIGVEPLIV